MYFPKVYFKRVFFKSIIVKNLSHIQNVHQSCKMYFSDIDLISGPNFRLGRSKLFVPKPASASTSAPPGDAMQPSFNFHSASPMPQCHSCRFKSLKHDKWHRFLKLSKLTAPFILYCFILILLLKNNSHIYFRKRGFKAKFENCWPHYWTLDCILQ